jgi:hypothetical protein
LSFIVKQLKRFSFDLVHRNDLVLLGSLFMVHFLLRGRKHLDFRNAALLLLGLVSLAIEGMNVYVIAHGGVGYCTYPSALRIVKRVLVGIAALIVVTVAEGARVPC